MSACQLAMEEGQMVTSDKAGDDYLQEDAVGVQAPLLGVQ